MIQNINLDNLTSTQGIKITGVKNGDYAGYSVNSAGDVNGDGIMDLIIGAYGVSGNDGSSYVIFGKNNGLSDINLATLTSEQGFSMFSTSVENSGWSVSGAGDINGDGLGDIVIGAPNAGKSGIGYVVFGKKSDFNPINLDSMTATQGFSIIGGVVRTGANEGRLGMSVSGAGDFNGDGFNDIIIGQPYAKANQGVSYVIYGHKGTFNNINITNVGELSAGIGFSIMGTSDSWAGYSVSRAGDINHDGRDDIIIGAPSYTYAPTSIPTAGVSYIIYGTHNPTNISLANLSADQGFSVEGAAVGNRIGWSVSSAGDVNKDGYDDVMIGAPFVKTSSYNSETGYVSYANAGTSYLIFGNSSGNLANISLADASKNGWTCVESRNVNSGSGRSVSGVGDFNGDGIDDIIIGAPGAPNQEYNNPGSSYVIFGHKDFRDTMLLPPALSQGFSISGAPYSQSGFFVSGVGDVNGDGVDDIIIGAPSVSSNVHAPGTSYVLFGGNIVDSGFEAA